METFRRLYFHAPEFIKAFNKSDAKNYIQPDQKNVEAFIPKSSSFSKTADLKSHEAKLRSEITAMSNSPLPDIKDLKPSNRKLEKKLLGKLDQMSTGIGINKALELKRAIRNNIVKFDNQNFFNAEEFNLYNQKINSALASYTRKVDLVTKDMNEVKSHDINNSTIDDLVNKFKAEKQFLNEHQNLSPTMFNLLKNIISDSTKVSLTNILDNNDMIPFGHQHDLKLSLDNEGNILIDYLNDEAGLARNEDDNTKLDFTLKVAEDTKQITIIRNDSKLAANLPEVSQNKFTHPRQLFEHIFLDDKNSRGLNIQNDFIGTLKGSIRMPKFISPQHELESSTIARDNQKPRSTFFNGVDLKTKQAIDNYLSSN